jgi:hypothetical protein
MPIACRLKLRFGPSHCTTDCAAGPDFFRFVRVEKPEDVPPEDSRALDVVILDMNHGWPNLGHDSLVFAVKDAACDLIEPLRETGLFVRALSFDVRKSGMIPPARDGRYSIFLGTGGPGEFDPHLNTGSSLESQGIVEDPSWEDPFFDLLESVRSNEDAALLAVCHTFGVLCRWSGIAEPRLRGPEKGGKSTGLLENILTSEARSHPWFSRLSQELPDGKRLRIVDNRLFDLIPHKERFDRSTIPIAHETAGVGGPEGEGITMIEFARDRHGVMPRIFGANNHPEIVARGRQRMILTEKLKRGEVTEEWYRERLDILTRTYPDEDSDQRLHVTSDYTLLGPLRFYLFRLARKRAQSLGFKVEIHEDRILEEADDAALGSSRPRGSTGGA